MSLENAHRSVRRFISQALASYTESGDPWTTVLEDRFVPDEQRPVAVVAPVGPSAREFVRASIPQGTILRRRTFVATVYPETCGTSREAGMRAERIAERLLDAVEIGIVLLTPTPAPLVSVTPAAGGGSFAAGTYYWKVSAMLPEGETVPSGEVSAVVPAGGRGNLSWAAVPRADGYRVYRTVNVGAESISPAFVAFVGSGTVYEDTGIPVTAGKVSPAEVAVGGPLRIPVYDFESIPEIEREMTAGPTVPYAYLDVIEHTVDMIADPEDDRRWTIPVTLRVRLYAAGRLRKTSPAPPLVADLPGTYVPPGP